MFQYLRINKNTKVLNDRMPLAYKLQIHKQCHIVLNYSTKSTTLYPKAFIIKVNNFVGYHEYSRKILSQLGSTTYNCDYEYKSLNLFIISVFL